MENKRKNNDNNDNLNDKQADYARQSRAGPGRQAGLFILTIRRLVSFYTK